MREIAIIRIVGEHQGSYEDYQYTVDLVKSKITDWQKVEEPVFKKLSSALHALKLYEQGYRLIERESSDEFILTTVERFDKWVDEQEKRRAAERAAREAKKAVRDQKKLLKEAKTEKQLLEELAKKHGFKVAPAK